MLSRAASVAYFEIEVQDAESGRGVPLVELRTVNEIRHFTDSAGRIAFHEPGLMDREVFFHVQADGYEVPKDGFGFRGVRFHTSPGESGRLKIQRINIAERLYRITGQGIYGESVLLGHDPRLADPVLNGRVLGQDTVMAAVYRGKIYWFWGDTQRESYPLGQFATSGATSELPQNGGLDPAVGINLSYFVDESGFSRPMAPLEGEGMVWIDGLVTIDDPSGRERLVTHYARMKSLEERLEHGLMVFNDDQELFEVLARFPADTKLEPAGQAFRGKGGNSGYLYFAQPYPFVRVKAEWSALTNLAAYEAFTCLEPGSDYMKDMPRLDRTAEGRLVWSWKANTAWVNATRQKELIESGQMRPEEAWIDIRDAASGRAIRAHRGSVRWNHFRNRYVMIFQEIFGKPSFGGEVWFAEAETPEGPWRRAHKIVTHRQYTFYNPCQHAFFDQEGGRIIYFEGTYTAEFSDVQVPTPRYNYNQILYRLDLADPRLE